MQNCTLCFLVHRQCKPLCVYQKAQCLSTYHLKVHARNIALNGFQQMLSVNWCNSYTHVLYIRGIFSCTSRVQTLLELIRLKEIYHIICSAGLLNKWNESRLLTSHLQSCSGRVFGTLWRALKVWLGQYQSQGILRLSSSVIWGVLKQTPLDD